MQSARASHKRKADADLPQVDRVTGRGMMGMPSADEPDDEALEAAEAARAAAEAEAASPASSSEPRPVGPRMPRVRVGNRHLTMHSELVEMKDSTSLYDSGDFLALRQRLEEEGFLFVRGVLPPATVKAARIKMLAHLRDKGAMREGTNWEDAFIEYQRAWDAKQKHKAGGRGASKKQKADTGSGSMGMAACPPPASSSSAGKMIPGWTVDAESGGLVGGRESDAAVAGWHAIGNSKELTDVYNGPALKSFYQRLFENDADYTSRPHLAAAGVPPYSTLPNCTWLRAKGPGEVTAEHADYYYFAQNTTIFGDYYTRAQHEPPQQKAEREARDDKVSKMSEEEKETCQLCRDPKDPDTTLLCDLCGLGYHAACLSPALPSMPDEEQEWHCYSCQNAPMDYWTCWTAMGDIAGLDGRLALIPGSHRLCGYEQHARPDLLPSGFTRAFELSSIWQTPTSIGMGDIILFNLKLVHAATRNGGEKFRLSLDTRITTCKGRKFLENNGLTSLDAPVPVPVELKSKAKEKGKAQGIKDGAKAKASTVSSMFRSQRPKA